MLPSMYSDYPDPFNKMAPLDGITVVTIEQAVAAPFATRQLADLGARVIKIERPQTGDFARAYDQTVRGMASSFVWLNRSKESLTLDVKHPRSSEILNRLMERADVFVQNLAPGAAARLGLSADALLERYPRLVVCDISGYGDTGPYRDKKAYDLLIQGESGLMSITGTPEAPAKAGNSIADISAGMYAYSGILVALFQREKTGKGGRVEVSMFEALCEWMMFPLYYANCGGLPFRRSGPNHAAIFPYGPFHTNDGRTVMIGIQNEREWKVFCERVLNCPEITADPRFDSNSQRVANRDSGENTCSSSDPLSVSRHPSSSLVTKQAVSSSFRRLLSTLCDIASARCASSRNFTGPSRSSHNTRNVQRRPSRSSNAMIGRPVLEPRTARPGRAGNARFMAARCQS